tara:strand:+ start:204 stop:755 length:552 start_codon:yes stop_codon:yes gene_type:complete
MFTNEQTKTIQNSFKDLSFFRRVTKQLDPSVLPQLLAWQETYVNDYMNFSYKGEADGNTVFGPITTEELPSIIVSTFSEAIDCAEDILLLKNKGNVVLHYDVTRQASLTIPLNVTKSCTRFWDDDEKEICQLYHNGEAYLQNNKAVHSVEDNGDEVRYFLQLCWHKHNYIYWQNVLEELGYFK